MFTGLVEETGTLVDKAAEGEGFQLTFRAVKTLKDMEIGSSIAVNGCCLTVVKLNSETFSVDVIEETLKKTNLGKLTKGKRVNLERPVKADDRMGGHFVLGHIDTTGEITKITALSNSHFMTISFPSDFARYLIFVGSVAIDGVSMTVAELMGNTFSVGIIPHTWDETIFSDKKTGDSVNLEFDVLGKYVERIMEIKPGTNEKN